jgi:hypothetical protein
MNLNQMLSRTRTILRDISAKATNAVQWTDLQILEALNAANDSFWTIALGVDESWGLDNGTLQDLGATLTPQEGNLLIAALPKDVLHIKHIEEGATADQSGVPLGKIELHDRWRHNTGSRWEPSRRAWMHGTERAIYFTASGGSVATSSIRIWYTRAAPRLVRFDAVSKTANVLQVELDRSALEDSGGLGLLVPRKNYYRNTFFECVNAGGALPESEEILCASYDRSTDGHPFWDFVVSTHTIGSGGSIWASVPVWSEPHHERLCVLAADSCLDSAGEAVGKTIIQNRVQKATLEFTQMMQKRDLVGSRYVNLARR